MKININFETQNRLFIDLHDENKIPFLSLEHLEEPK